MFNKNTISIEYLHERLRYEPKTGKLYWHEFSGASRRWNSRWAGAEAGTTSKHGYRVINVDGVFFRAHRIVWALMHGTWPTEDIDHIDHDRTNNRFENLRVVGRKDNCRNSSLSKRNTSGYVGVTWCRRTQKWQAQISPDRCTVHLGRFHDIGDAVAARKAAEAEYGFHANHGVKAGQPA